jgi:hypothetical protein
MVESANSHSIQAPADIRDEILTLFVLVLTNYETFMKRGLQRFSRPDILSNSQPE